MFSCFRENWYNSNLDKSKSVFSLSTVLGVPLVDVEVVETLCVVFLSAVFATTSEDFVSIFGDDFALTKLLLNPEMTMLNIINTANKKLNFLFILLLL